MKYALITISAFALCANVHAQSNKVYWSTGTQIGRADLDGSNSEVVVSGLSAPIDVKLARCDGKIYWSDSVSRRIQRANLDGSNIETIYASQAPWRPSGIALDFDARQIYFGEIDGTPNGAGQITDSRLSRVDFDGSNATVLLGLGPTRPFGIELDLANDRMYWAEFATGDIRSARLDGSQAAVLANTSGSAAALALDLVNRRVYWADAGEFGPVQILRVNLDGTGLQVLPIVLNDNPSIALDPQQQRLFFTDQATDSTIKQADLDGSNVVDLLTVPGFSVGLHVSRQAPGSTYCTAVPNSTGQPGELCAEGTALVAANDTVLVAKNLPQNTFGLFITSQAQGFTANPGGSAGNLCLGGEIGRYVGPAQIRNSGADGTISLWVDLLLTPQASGFVAIGAGETWNFQAWYRDLNGGLPTSNFTTPLAVPFQ